MSPSVTEVWQLVRGKELLGEIIVSGGDFPWLSGTFVPQPAFVDVRPLFDAELACIEAFADEAREGDVDAWEQAYSRITESMSLVSPRGPVPEFLLHIEGAQAWFRWSDEPFEQD